MGGVVKGGMEGQRWRCWSDRTECGRMVAQRVVLQPRKKKETTTGSTDSTDFTKLQSQDKERNEKMTKNINKDQGTGLMPST